MKMSEVNLGMKVRISNNIEKTIDRWTASKEMETMRGGIFTVYLIRANSVNIMGNSGLAWTFAPEDLSMPNIKPPPQPVLFDPKNIIE